MRRLWFIIVAFLCFSLILSGCGKSSTTVPPTTTQAVKQNQVVARINIQSGSAQYQSGSGNSFVAAADQTGLVIGDKVISAAGALIAIEFQDGSSLVLLPNTEIEIQNYTETRQDSKVTSRVARVAVISGDISGDIRQDLVYPPSVFEVVSAGEIYTIKGNITQ